MREFWKRVWDCYTTPKDAGSQAKLKKLAAFCRRMGRDLEQGEIGLVIADHYSRR